MATYSFIDPHMDAERCQVEYFNFDRVRQSDYCQKMTIQQEFGNLEIRDVWVSLPVLAADMNRYFAETFPELYKERLFNRSHSFTPEMVDHYLEGCFEIEMASSLYAKDNMVVCCIKKLPEPLEIDFTPYYDIPL